MTDIFRSEQAGGARRHLGSVDEAELRSAGFEVGEWRVEPRRHRIVGAEGEKRLDPRLIDVLIELARAGGEVVTRDELLNAVWKDTFVSENTLSQAVSRLRRALGDSSREPRFIETISRSGYRLVAPVSFEIEQRLAAAAEEPVGPLEPGARRPRSRGLRVLPWALVGVLGLAVVVLALARDTPSASPPPVALIRPELTLVGNQFEPRLSPSGDQVVFAWEEPGSTSSFDLWVQTIGGDSPVRVTSSEAMERLPAWSPDGQRLAYFAPWPERETCGLFVAPVLGGAPERLADCTGGHRSLAWSPDGRLLAHDGISADGSGGRALFLLNVATGEHIQLTSPPEGAPGDTGVRFSPNGEMLAFEREMGLWRDDVAVVPVEGGEPLVLTNDAWGKVRGVDWASDGSAVLFSSNRVGQFALWRVDLEGGAPERVPIHDAWVTQPSVSRAGGRLIYRTFRDAVDIWELPLDARGVPSQEGVLRLASSRSERQPTWSPRGDRIAFISDRSGSEELWSGRLDGSELIRHTALNGALPASPAWSPDANSLVFDAASHGHSDLFVVKRQSRRPTRLTHEPSEEKNASYSRDGSTIYFASDREDGWEIWSMPTAGGPARRMTRGGGFLAQESLDGTTLFYSRLEEPGIWAMPVAGGASRQLLRNLDLADWGSWVVAADGIYFVGRRPTSIRYVRFDRSEPQVVFEPPKQMPYLSRDLSLSPDGRSLLFSMIDHSDDEVMTADLAGL